MRIFLASLLAVFMITLPVADNAEAKRLGGGFSLGKSFSSPKKSTAPTQQKKSTTDQTQQQNTTTTTPKRTGFGGLMGGLLAGGLFGALLFGGAFEGIQFMDLLLIAAVIFIIYKIMSMRKAPQQQAYAGQGAQQYEINTHQQRTAEPEPTPEFKPLPSFSSGWGESSEVVLPTWFNKEAFLEQARVHFMTLQQAWDQQDWDSIKEYTSPELFEQLQLERARLPDGQVTEVVSVMAELINFIDNRDEVIVSINFYGWLKEDSEETTEFNETWHLSRDMTVENADWFIVGIQQD